MNKFLIVLSTLATICIAQRSPYAGRNPVGYPYLDPTTTTTTAAGLGNRPKMSPTTMILLLLAVVPCFCQRPFYAGKRPIGYPQLIRNYRQTEALVPPELKGDLDYAKRLDQMPVDQQPFWYLNRNQYNDLRNNPKTYPLRPSGVNENTL